jgi:DNA-binding PadR family transcriptional regulator
MHFRAGTSGNNRRAKFYRLTARGRRQLAIEISKWDKLAGAQDDIERGMSPEEVPYAAVRKFGNVTRVKVLHLLELPARAS